MGLLYCYLQIFEQLNMKFWVILRVEMGVKNLRGLEFFEFLIYWSFKLLYSKTLIMESIKYFFLLFYYVLASCGSLLEQICHPTNLDNLDFTVCTVTFIVALTCKYVM